MVLEHEKQQPSIIGLQAALSKAKSTAPRVRQLGDGKSDLENHSKPEKLECEDAYAMVDVAYLKNHRNLKFSFKNGLDITLPIKVVSALAELSDEILSEAFISPNGETLIIESIDLDISVRGLISKFIPLSIARSAVASADGKLGQN